MNTKIFAAGVGADIGTKVVLWNEPGGFSFYSNKKFYQGNSNLNLAQLQTKIKSFTIHHTDDYKARQTASTLIARGLSVNFIIDDDPENEIATIYQCLDMKDGGYSQKPLNEESIGVEVCLRPLASKQPYSPTNVKSWNVSPHPVVEDTVHGQKFSCHGPTEAQHKALIRLLRGFSELFPGIPMMFPRDKDGNYIKTNIPNPEQYRGLLNHYNIERQKIDCLGLDHGKIENDFLYG